MPPTVTTPRGEQDVDSTGHPQREQTDESLRVERDTADSGVADKLEAVEEAADEVVRIARQRADHIVHTTRDDGDRERGPQSKATKANSEHERARADVRLADERSNADAALQD